MSTLFSVIFCFSFVVAVISSITWIVQKIRHIETKARRVCMISVPLAVVSIIVSGVTYDGPTKENDPPAVESTEPAQSDAQTPEETPTTVTTPEPEDAPEATTEPPAASSPEQTQTPEETPTPEPAPVNLPVQERPVMNGTGTERIGTWARIITTKEYLATISGRALYDYLEDMAGSDYNWVNVTFGDGTGLYCYMDGYLIEYGCVDEKEGGAVEPGDGIDVRYFHFDADTGTYIEDTE